MSRPGFRIRAFDESSKGGWTESILQPVVWSCESMARWSAALGDLVFPAACAFCGDPPLALRGGWPLCRVCLGRLAAPQPPACTRCGIWLPVLVDGRPLLPCPHCARRGTTWPLRAVRALGPYAGIHREAVLRMKRRRGAPLAAVMGKLLADRCWAATDTCDAVVPVPVHWRRRLGGTFDRCSLLAEELAARLQLPVVRAVRCRRLPQKQGLLSPAQRRRNVSNIFQVPHASAISDMNILLVDDVATTGATACAAARALRRAGAAAVELAVVARAMPTGTRAPGPRSRAGSRPQPYRIEVTVTDE